MKNSSLLFPLSPECGLKSDHFRRKRIIGGTLSEDGSWPWTVALMAGTKMICAGTIISKEWVLTAGHCVQEYVLVLWMLRVNYLKIS